MQESKLYYFYLWRHRFLDDATDSVLTRTCFGITSNPTGRIQGYEGHVGHMVKFTGLWTGPERLVRELENRIKSDFYAHIVTGTNGYRYEWINEHIEHQAVHGWVQWEIENTFIGITNVHSSDLLR
jgi:hypothetical protein